ncbi:hypothetical protein ACH50O_01805 [Methylomonas sp. 2BW1-5-20]|uniref:hypothetical protein n=1 Tax=Methylomonas sp. 2BW1-5-20 TaxID=3376686 RepID=UPI00404D547E
MKTTFEIGVAIAAFFMFGQAVAEPMKCVVGGKTIYTDDIARCAKGIVKPINGSVLISAAPRNALDQNSKSKSAFGLPFGLNGVLDHFGLSQKEVEDGWKTVMDAHKRGSWQEPVIPDEAK